MVKMGSPIKSFRDLTGRSVVVTAGTTNEKTMHELDAKFKLNTKIVTAAVTPTRTRSWWQARSMHSPPTTSALRIHCLEPGQDQLMVVSDFLSYGSLRHHVPQETIRNWRTWSTLQLRELAASRELEQTYNKWFLRQLPSGRQMNQPDRAAQLAEMIPIMGDDAATRGSSTVLRRQQIPTTRTT